MKNGMDPGTIVFADRLENQLYSLHSSSAESGETAAAHPRRKLRGIQGAAAWSWNRFKLIQTYVESFTTSLILHFALKPRFSIFVSAKHHVIDLSLLEADADPGGW